jgi:hypothetical protein
VQHLTVRSSNIRLVCAPTAADIMLPRLLVGIVCGIQAHSGRNCN